MTDESIEARLTAIEEQLGMESGLRAALDRNLSTIAQRQAAANHPIQALSIAQSQHTEELATHTELLRSAHTKLDLLVAMLGRLSDEPDQDLGRPAEICACFSRSGAPLCGVTARKCRSLPASCGS